MPDESPGMRTLTISERGVSTIYGSIPSAFVQIALRAIFGVLEQPDYSFWPFMGYTFFGPGLCLGCASDVRLNELGLPYLLGSGMYAVFYFTFGRSLGHMAVNAHIVHYGNGRAMRTWQKALRSWMHLMVGSNLAVWTLLSGVSACLVLVDRRRRRSLFDFAAGTVVIIGEPTEEEPESEKARASVLNRTLGRLTGRRSAPERG